MSTINYDEKKIAEAGIRVLKSFEEKKYDMDYVRKNPLNLLDNMSEYEFTFARFDDEFIEISYKDNLYHMFGSYIGGLFLVENSGKILSFNYDISNFEKKISFSNRNIMNFSRCYSLFLSEIYRLRSEIDFSKNYSDFYESYLEKRYEKSLLKLKHIDKDAAKDENFWGIMYFMLFEGALKPIPGLLTYTENNRFSLD